MEIFISPGYWSKSQQFFTYYSLVCPLYPEATCVLWTLLNSATILLVVVVCIVFTSRYWQFYVLQISVITPWSVHQQKLRVASVSRQSFYKQLNWGLDKDTFQRWFGKLAFVILVRNWLELLLAIPNTLILITNINWYFNMPLLEHLQYWTNDENAWILFYFMKFISSVVVLQLSFSQHFKHRH